MDFDLSDPKLLLRGDVVADPRPLYDTLRRQAPVWRLPGQNSYLVADPMLIREAVSRPEEFSSNLVSLLHRNVDGYQTIHGTANFFSHTSALPPSPAWNPRYVESSTRGSHRFWPTGVATSLLP